mgnify:CR=1 FL=1
MQDFPTNERNRNDRYDRDNRNNRETNMNDDMMEKFKQWLQSQNNNEVDNTRNNQKRQEKNMTGNMDELLKQSISERKNIDNQIKTQPSRKFDPMKSPSDDDYQNDFFFDQIMKKINHWYQMTLTILAILNWTSLWLCIKK